MIRIHAGDLASLVAQTVKRLSARYGRTKMMNTCPQGANHTLAEIV